MDQTTDFVEGETVYWDGGGTLTPMKVTSVKSTKTRGGIRWIIKAGDGTYDGGGHPRTSDKYSRVSIRKRTPDLDERYKRQCLESELEFARRIVRDWTPEELELIGDAIIVAKKMRKHRLSAVKMNEEQFMAALAAMTRKGEQQLVFSGLDEREAEMKAGAFFNLKNRWDCRANSAYGIITLTVRFGQ